MTVLYDGWVVGGKTVPHVREAKIDQKEHTITLSCSAIKENIATGDNDVRDEIADFQAMSSQYINNEPLLNGGTKLQVGNGSIITVTDDTNTWTRCALEPIQINEDSKSVKRDDYDLVIHYEAPNPGGSFVYTPDYDEYSNVDYYFWYNPVTQEKTAWGGQNVGTELGYMEITEAQNVIRVEVYGCGDGVGDDYYIECNGEKQYWHYGETIEDNVPLLEKFVFNLDTPTTTVILNSGMHVEGGDNFGCYLAWVRVVYE